MTVPENLRYTKNHEWVKPVTAGTVRIGITDYAQRQLGDIVYVELPKVGARILRLDVAGTVESVKPAVVEAYAPVSGTVIARNERIILETELINTDPYGDGWLIDLGNVAPEALDNLLDAAGYTQYLKDEADQ